eukprot:3153593-Alexandrium_andersonii.AAC.1
MALRGSLGGSAQESSREALDWKAPHSSEELSGELQNAHGSSRKALAARELCSAPDFSVGVFWRF